MLRAAGRCAAIAVGCGLLLAGGAGAASAQAINLHMNSMVAPTGQQAADQAVVDAAFADMNRGGFAKVEPHLGALREVLGRAPPTFPLVERSGETLLIRVEDDTDFMILSLIAGTQVAKGDGSTKDRAKRVDVVRGVNTYPMAALLLGSYFNELKRPQEALPYLDRGLALQPNNFGLIIEKGASLVSMRRLADAVAVYDSALDGGDLALIGKRSRLLRNRGVALIDLNRLDEAEKSLKDSIKEAKDDKIGVARAKQELAYIKGLRQGARPSGIELQTRKQAEEAAAAPPK